MLKTLQREAQVVIHGQSFRFRVIKYIFLIGIIIVLYNTYGSQAVIDFLLFGIIIGLSLHFFFRWKTNGWRKSWGLYKKDTL